MNLITAHTEHGNQANTPEGVPPSDSPQGSLIGKLANVRKPLLYLNQYGKPFWARTRRELHNQVGGGRVSIMYCDKSDGSTVRVGYVIGQHWLTAYQPVETLVTTWR